MKVYHLGLIIFGSIILMVIIGAYKNNEEGLNVSHINNIRKKNLKKRKLKWGARLYPRLKGTDGGDMKMLVKEGNQNMLKQVNPSVKVEKNQLEKQIDKCNLINETNDCDKITGNDCGYCVSTNIISAGNSKGSYADVCPGDNNWIAPGPQTAYYCKKRKEQKLCKTMKDCGDNSGDKSICGWCPATGSGVPKKILANGGWVPKYSDDKCEWKKGDKKKISWLGWTPNKGGEKQDIGEGDCDRDSDCGPGLKCGHDGRRLKGLVYNNGNEIKPNAGYKDYCYDPNSFEFKGSLIKPEDCAKFGQMFPCVGKNMFTGPHSESCLRSEWKKSGCNGDVFDRIDNNDKINYSKVSYLDVGNNMKESIKKVADNSNDYKKSKSAFKKCYGKEVNPCLTRFNPRPIECAKKIYNQSGCTSKGKLNPKLTNEWPNSYVNSTWKQGQMGGWSVNTYKSKLMNYIRRVKRLTWNPKSNFSELIDKNMGCYGKMPNIPWDKPCWKDFSQIVNALPNVNITNNGTTISFSNASSNIKSLLPLSSRGSGWKKNITWSGNYILTKKIYNEKYFPFWNFVQVSKNYWKGNWGKFKTALLKDSSISISSKKVNSKWFGWTPSQARGRRGLKKGEGDCDSDRDCKPGLKCGHDSYSLPGINRAGLGGSRDFCYNPMDKYLNDALKIKSGSVMSTIIGQSSNKNIVKRDGLLLKRGNNLYLTKEAFISDSFPYWIFLNSVI